MSPPPQDREPRDGHEAGDTVREGRFAITGRLGEGGQATTFEAIDKREGRRVTVKRFRVKGASTWKEVELAEREARVLATLRHPNLPVYVDHFEEGGSLYLVTELIEGETLSKLRDAGPTSEELTLRFLRDAGAALDYLHDRPAPIVHRDIKPSNVIRRRDGSFAIIDFGAVRERLKATGSTVVGTFGYMAPEQFQGRSMPASDVYAVGTTAVAMLAGREPEDLPHKGLAIDVAGALPGARPALVRALQAMVEPDPDKRASRIAPLLADLGEAKRQGDARKEGAAKGAGRGGEAGAPRWDDPAQRSDTAKAAAEEAERVVTEAEQQVKRVASELGDQVRRVVAEVAAGRGNAGAQREARKVVEIAKREAKRAVKEAKREARRGGGRRAEAEVRVAVAEERKREAIHRWEERRRARRPLGGPVLLVVLIALTIAQLAVLLGLKVVAPIVLHVVALLFFGSEPAKAMRAAAGHVSAAGTRAAAALRRAQDVVRGRAPAEAAAVAGGAASGDAGGAGAGVDPHAPTVVSTVGSKEAAAGSDVRVRSRFDDGGARGASDERRAGARVASGARDSSLDDDARIEAEAAAEAEEAAAGPVEPARGRRP